jgi:hypothetical protein
MAYMVKRPGGLAIQTFSREELAARAARGEIKRDWLVRADAGGKWERMDEVFEAEWPVEISAPKPEEAAPPARAVAPAAEASAEAQSPPIPSAVAATLPPQTGWTKSAIKRYRDAYTVAAFLVTGGSTVKGLGVVCGALLMVIGLAVAAQGGFGVVLGVAGLVAGPIGGAIFFIWGIVISARGQELRAELDVAVYASPFLNDAERASVMSL